MISWLIEQAVVMTPLLLFLVVFQQFGFKKLSASIIYACWLVIPLSLLFSCIDFTSISTAPPSQPQLMSYQQELVKYNQVIHQYSTPILLVWIFGFCSLLANYLIRHILFFKHLEMKECLSLRNLLPKNIGAYSASRISTPFSSGYFSPIIVVPKAFQADYTKQQQQMIIAHELKHIRRGDLFWNFLVMLIHMAFWFNPAVWYARKHFHLCQEVSCDELVLADKTKQQKLSYSKALLVSQTSKQVNSPMSASFFQQGFYSCRLIQITTSSASNKAYLLPLLVLLILINFSMQFSVHILENFHSGLIKPIMRILPVYPEKAASNDIEGFAIASFSINEDGQTENIKINTSQPAGAFDNEVINAIETWQYKKPQDNVDGVEVQLNFRKQNSQPIKLVKKNTEGILVTPK
ncbi:M56 family metallopeptidase [Colwellia psychrerythraea]|uniref:Protein TonB n=1 Tax=Colwellia psychrerythraea TaxID=28229 RepID=A0A099L046_COLPS|nr:M56 family metallopeptidase [Colwellia psychrerythraea]KGJ95238.1 TonB family protein [Colwellia psychrerythraea]